MDADLVLAGGHDVLDHLRMQKRADGGDVERGGDVLFRQQTQDPRHAVHRAVLAARERLRSEVAASKRRGRVVDVEAERDGDASAVRPRDGLQAPPRTDAKHLPLQLVER